MLEQQLHIFRDWNPLPFTVMIDYIQIGMSSPHRIHHRYQCALVLCSENLRFVSKEVALCDVLKQTEALDIVLAAHFVVDNILKTQLSLSSNTTYSKHWHCILCHVLEFN